ncbi:MAG: DJ-1/PfpI family protein [bacterium]
MTRFGILLFDGAEELDVFGPFEVLGAAQNLGAPLEVQLGTLGPASEISLAFGTRLASPAVLAPRTGDWIVVPGGGWLSGAPQGARAEVQRGEIPKRLAAWRAAGVRFASVCTGAMLVAAAGISVDRVATTHHAALADLEATGILAVKSRVVDDGDLVSCGGVSSGIDLGLWLVERCAGVEMQRRVRDYLEYPGELQVHFGPNASPRT